MEKTIVGNSYKTTIYGMNLEVTIEGYSSDQDKFLEPVYYGTSTLTLKSGHRLTNSDWNHHAEDFIKKVENGQYTRIN